MSARAMRREAERRERKALRRAGGRILFHGTTEPLARIIQREGLIVRDGVPPFLTVDEDRAAGYALRAVCLDLDDRGLADRPSRALRGAVLVVHAGPDEIVADTACEDDWAAPSGLPAARIASVRLLDLREQIPSSDEVAMQARRMLHARDLERTCAIARPYSQVMNGAIAVAMTALERAREH